MEWYNGQVCAAYRDQHVFASEEHYRVCECGLMRKAQCRCSECNLPHTRMIPTTLEEQMSHGFLKLELRILSLEQAPKDVLPQAAEAEGRIS